MFTRIEALNYRCLRWVSQDLDPFHVLVGPNASGKTTFLDVISFCSRVVSDGLAAAIDERTSTWSDLTWRREGGRFEFALEARIPEERSRKLSQSCEYDTARYELAIDADDRTGELGIVSESVRIRRSDDVADTLQRSLFPEAKTVPKTLVIPSGKKEKIRRAVSKTDAGTANFYSEVYKDVGKGWVVNYRLGPQKSALANLPEDESKFPVSTWFKEFIASGIQTIVLDSRRMRETSPPGQVVRFKTDGSNLPWVVKEFRESHPDRFDDWVAHLQTALPDLIDVRSVELPDTRHRHLVVEYEGGLEVPSWTLSDGTLRLVALTLLAYLPELRGCLLIEEPENGIHPRAIESMYQSLSHVYDAQILMATHSQVVLSNVPPEQVLCFAKDGQGATDVVRGDRHPALVDWRNDPNLGILFAAGVLG